MTRRLPEFELVDEAADGLGGNEADVPARTARWLAEGVRHARVAPPSRKPSSSKNRWQFRRVPWALAEAVRTTLAT